MTRRKQIIDDWIPAFGQIGASATYLKNIGIQEGDIFLFFGSFHCVEMLNGVVRYCKNTGNFYNDNDLQVIWGYLQIGRILDTPETQRALWWHPHADENRTSAKTNVIFAASEHLSFDPSKPGAGVLKFDKKRVLTLEGHNKATWKKNEIYDIDHIYGNRKNSAKDPETGIYYSGIWQELGLKESDACTEWAMDIISDYESKETGSGNVLLTAEEHNRKVQSIDDWHKSLYILRNDGELTIITYEGKEITEKRINLSDKKLTFVRNHIGEYIKSAKKADSCNEIAWEIQHGYNRFDLGCVYGTDLEKITSILSSAKSKAK